MRKLFRGGPGPEGFEVRQRPARDVMYDPQEIIGTEWAPRESIGCLASDGTLDHGFHFLNRRGQVKEIAVGAKSEVDVVFNETAMRIEIVDLLDHRPVGCRARYHIQCAGKKANLVEGAENAP